MAFIDYHVHTPLCNHASGCMEAYVKQALARGLDEICFLEHLTLNPGGRRLSMAPQEVGLYFGAVRGIGARFEGRIQVKAGLEVDYSPETMDQARRIAETFAFDAIGGSVHFLDHWNMVSHRERGLRPPGSNVELHACYLEHLEAMVESSFFDFLCHLDVVEKFGDAPETDMKGAWDRIAGKIAEKGLAVELNTSGLRHPVGRIYPAPWLLRKLKAAGVGFTLGSDAHNPRDVGAGFEAAAALALEAGCTHWTTFTRRRPGQLPISAGDALRPDVLSQSSSLEAASWSEQ